MSQPEPEATPQQQEAVRRLLAEARHAEPLPADVAARLDGVLGELVAEGPRGIQPPPPVQQQQQLAQPQRHPHQGAVVVDLAARRRRRRVTGLLGAAAAVVVLGVGIGQVIERAGSDDTSSGNAGDGSGLGRGGASADQGQAEAAPDATPQGTPSEGGVLPPGPMGTPLVPSDQPSGSIAPPPLPAVVPYVSASDFRGSVLFLRGGGVVTRDESALGAADLTSDAGFVCPPTALGLGLAVAVSYDGSPAVLVYRVPTGDTQTVELLQCGSGTVLRSVVVPAS